MYGHVSGSVGAGPILCWHDKASDGCKKFVPLSDAAFHCCILRAVYRGKYLDKLRSLLLVVMLGQWGV